MSFESEPLFPRPTGELREFASTEEILVEAAFSLPKEETIQAQGQVALFLVDPVTKVFYRPGRGLL